MEPNATNDPDKMRGRYAKFKVERLDPEAAARHVGCDHFVLDLTHDPLAIPAIETYRRAAMAAGYRKLAEDLEDRLSQIRAGL